MTGDVSYGVSYGVRLLCDDFHISRQGVRLQCEGVTLQCEEFHSFRMKVSGYSVKNVIESLRQGSYFATLNVNYSSIKTEIYVTQCRGTKGLINH